MKKWINHLNNKNLSKNTIKTYLSVAKVLKINKNKNFNYVKNTILDRNKSINSQRLYYVVSIEYYKFIKNTSLLIKLKEIKLPPKPQIYMPIISKYRIENLNKKIITVDDEYWVKIIQFLFFTGIRANELNKIIKIKVNSIVIKGKGNKIREVFCKPDLLKTIKEYEKIFPFTLKTLRLKIKKFFR